MKKIIYSLVIMIAAGSLFTSCIQPIEPEGILALRNAKAAYYAALGDLRRAEAERERAVAALRLADAEVQKAQAELIKEQADNQRAMNELQRLLNEAQAMANEDLAAQLEAHLIRLADSLEVEAEQHKVNLTNAKIAQAAAEESLRLALRDIALAAKDLTAKEKKQLDSALTLYTTAFGKMMTAKAALDAANDAYIAAVNTWDNEDAMYYDDYKAYLERQIEQSNEAIAYYTEMLAYIPENAELDEWEAAIDAWTKDSLENVYNKHTLTEEMAAYFVNTVHDGQKDFDDFIQAWIDENGAAPTAPTQAQRDTVKGKDKNGKVVVPLDADGNVDKNADKYKTGNVTFTLDLLQDGKNGKISDYAWNKLVYLLGSYNKVGPISGKNMIAEVTGTPDTLRLIANAGMQELIMGTEGEEVDPVTVTINKNKYSAQYGIYGVQSILHRDFVIANKENDTTSTGKAYRAAKSAWEADFDSVMAGFGNYKPFTSAVDAYKTAVDNDASGDMIAALKTLKSEFDRVNGIAQSGFTYNDSLAILNAFKAFASARERFLQYTYKKGKQDHDSTYFRYSKGSGVGGHAIIDSVKFTELKFQDLRDKIYDFDIADPGNVPYNGNVNAGLYGIAAQLFNTTVAGYLGADPLTTGSVAKADIDAGLYNTYSVDVWPNPTAIMIGTTPYSDPKIAAAAAEVTNARETWIALFNRFWGETVTQFPLTIGATEETTFLGSLKDADKKKLVDAVNNGTLNKAVKGTNKYNLEYLKKGLKKEELLKVFTDPVNLVDSKVTPVEGLSAVLVSVDPNSTPTEGEFATATGIKNARLLYGASGNETEFTKYLKAKAAYEDALNDKFEQDLVIIDAWVKEVADKFAAMVENADKPNTAKGSAYAQDVENLKHSKKIVEKYDAYQEKLVKLVGADEDGVALIANPATLKFKNTGTTEVNQKVSDIEYKFVNEAGTALIDVIAGKWNDKVVGGEVAKKLEEIFPDFPAKLKAWKDYNDSIEDHKAHAEIVKNALMPAYYAAALAQGYDQAIADELLYTYGVTVTIGDYDDLMDAYHKLQNAYYTKLRNAIRAEQNKIYNEAAGTGYVKDLADLELGIDAKTIAIRNAKDALDKAQFDFEQALALCEQAEDYYEYILNIILELQSEL
ncbi:MAG: hypothetical protein K6G79_05020 [Bacteroidales bacterium]|nr:hypothetical protein [Bacteroidales bacterium]